MIRKKAPQLLRWTETEEKALEILKNNLCSYPVRHTLDFSKPLILQTDASARGLGAVLTQEIEAEEHPIIYLSQKLTPRERRYVTLEKEALAIKWATHLLKYYLLGHLSL